MKLDGLLRAAEKADGQTRMDYRDPIAAFGAPAIERLAPWLPITYRRPHCPGCSEEGQGDPWFVQ